MNIEQIKFPSKDKLSGLFKRLNINRLEDGSALGIKFNVKTGVICALCILLPMARTSQGISVFIWSFMAYTCIKKRREYVFFTPLAAVLPLIFFGWQQAVVTLFVMAALIAYPYLIKGEMNILSAAFYTAGAVFSSGLIMALIHSSGLIDIIYAACEGLLCICLTPIMARGMDCAENCRRKTLYTTQDTLCICVLLCAVIASVSFINIGGGCIALCLSALCICLAVVALSAGAAMSLSVLCGVSLCVFAGFPLGYIALVCISTLIGVLFRDLSRISATIMFFLAMALGSFLILATDELTLRLIALLTGSVIGALLSKSVIRRLAKLKNDNALAPATLAETLGSVVRDEIYMQKNMLGELSHNMSQCELNEDSDISRTICKMVASDVCSGCMMNEACWVDEGEDTFRVFNELITRCVVNPAVSVNNLPNRFISKCAHNQIMYKTVCYIYDSFKLKAAYAVKLGRFKNILNSQFVHLGRILDRLSEKISCGMKLNTADSLEALTALQNDGVNVSEVYVMDEINKKQRVVIKCAGELSDDELKRAVPLSLGDSLGKNMVFDHKSATPGRIKDVSYTFTEEYIYRLSTGFAGCCKGDAAYSGDKNSNEVLSGGLHMLAICDGMGSGKKAGAQSGRVLDMLEEMLNCGYEEGEAIDMINSVLVLDERDEIFTALDLFLFDLNKGVGEFVKAGASPSFIKRGNKTESVNFDTLPVGILEETHIQTGLKKFQKGDFIYFMSDGFYECVKSDDDYISERILYHDYRNPQKIADALFTDALKCADGRAGDDISVMVVKVRQTTLA